MAFLPFASLLALSSLFGNGAASPVQPRSPYLLKDTHVVPPTWSNVGPAPKDYLLELHIGLKQSKFDELERHLYEVSDPDHKRYGQHLSTEDVHELVKPSDKALDDVHGWLQDNDIEPTRLGYSPAKDWIKAYLTVGQVEDLLQTKYSVYRHEDGTEFVRTPEWSLPQHLHEHIDAIQPTNSFLRSKPQSNVAPRDLLETVAGSLAGVPDVLDRSVDTTASPGCNLTFVTIECLRKFYGTYGYKAQVPGKNRMGVANYGDETNNRSDVSVFLQKFRPEAAKAAYQFQIEVVAGGNNQQTPDTPAQLAMYKDVEADLDAETILGIAWPTPLHAWSTGGAPPFNPDLHDPTNHNEPYLTWLNYVLSEKNLPQVISTSYADDEQTVPKSYATKVCQEFAQLGARGVSVLFGSGDFGVGKNNTCVSNDGKNTSTFLPAFPAGCPYVTAVGATKNFNPEVVAYDAQPPRPNPPGFASGGGFSNYFPRPGYQNKVVPPYVQSLKGEFAGLYNPNGRAYPDISAQGQRIAYIWNGTSIILDGTSCSTPLAAGIITLVNDALIAAGKPPLGFLNPWLYSRGYYAFTDVTGGSAVGCEGAGFPAKKGWDPVTGFGTPYFPKVKENALKCA